MAVYDHGRPIKSVLFSVEERVEMIESVVGNRPNITILSYGAHRRFGAKNQCQSYRARIARLFRFRVRIPHGINQRLAPEVEVVTLIAREQNTFLSGSTVREIASFHGDVSSMVPSNIAAAFLEFFLEFFFALTTSCRFARAYRSRTNLITKHSSLDLFYQ